MDEAITDREVNLDRIMNDTRNAMFWKIQQFRSEINESIMKTIERYNSTIDRYSKLIASYLNEMYGTLSKKANQRLSYIRDRYGDILESINDDIAERRVRILAGTWMTMCCFQTIFGYEGTVDDVTEDGSQLHDMINADTVWDLFCAYVADLEYEITGLGVMISMNNE